MNRPMWNKNVTAQLKEEKVKPVTVSEDQVAIVLMAVAVLEGWDADRDSICLASDGSWTFKRVNDMRMPCPSDKLLNIIRGLCK